MVMVQKMKLIMIQILVIVGILMEITKEILMIGKIYIFNFI